MPFLDYKKKVINEFNFLVIDYGFELLDIRNESYGYYISYKKDNLLISLGYEYREERFFYYLNDGKQQISFTDFFKRYDSSINWPQLMPKEDNFSNAIEKNINLLRKYGVGFLSGLEEL